MFKKKIENLINPGKCILTYAQRIGCNKKKFKAYKEKKLYREITEM